MTITTGDVQQLLDVLSPGLAVPRRRRGRHVRHPHRPRRKVDAIDVVRAPEKLGHLAEARGPTRACGQERANRCTHVGATRNASARSAATLTRGRSAEERKQTKRGTHSGWYFAFAR
jgi:hypothetical protein